MNPKPRLEPDQVRERILDAAEALFRRMGYSKTTVADIAGALSMSGANVYRFFPSKQALNEAVCEGLLGELLKAARQQLEAPGTASQRIAGMMLTIHRLMRDQMTDHARVHEVVQIACDEVWPPIVDYLHKCAAMLADVIAEGQSTGEFGPGDPKELGWRTLQACVIIENPTMIAQYPTIRPETRPEHAVEFALRALSNKDPPEPIPET